MLDVGAGGALEVRRHDVLRDPTEHGADEALANRLRTRIRTLMAERGADLTYGRTCTPACTHSVISLWLGPKH